MYNHAAEIIAPHLDRGALSQQVHTGLNTVCAFTGKRIQEGVRLRDTIKDTFTDQAYIRYPSEYVSMEIALVLNQTLPAKDGRYNCIRNYSFLATPEKLTLLSNREILGHLLAPPANTWFVIVASYSNKKHIAFKAKLNAPQPGDLWSSIIVSTDRGDVHLSRAILLKFLPIVFNWYRIIPDKINTEAQPTWFTKQEIRHGCQNYAKIERYGADLYLEENARLAPYRESDAFELILHTLTKQV